MSILRKKRASSNMIKRGNENLNLARLPIPPRGPAGMAVGIPTPRIQGNLFALTRENPAFITNYFARSFG